MERIAVIGAGISGLTCAYELQKTGQTVEVYEREARVGGRMATRRYQGLAFDLGANFLVKAYPRLVSLSDELGVELQNLSPVGHMLYRHGSFHRMNFDSPRDIIRMDYLKLWSRVKFAEFALRLRHQYPHLDFFDLSTAPDELNHSDAYDTARRQIGPEFADYILDAFHTCMMFYRSRETSAAAFLALFRMKSDPAYDFSILHAPGEMQELPDALAARLTVKADHGVVSLAHHEDGWLVTTADSQEHYAKVVLATTAGVARKLLRNGPDPHRDLLEKTRYARTINLSYRVPAASFGNTHCFYIPYCENSVIAEFTNEAIKGRSNEGLALVNVGLHEEAAEKLWDRPDNQLFGLVAAELVKLHPGLSPEPHDLQRWPEAMPKFTCDQIDRVKRFLPHQGEQGLYLCGDYLNSPWLEGATRCGQRVAKLITSPGSGPRSDLP